jgi:hypothetical protein
VTLEEYEEILKAALVSLHTGQLINATSLKGAEQEKRLALDFDLLIALQASARKVAAEKLKG